MSSVAITGATGFIGSRLLTTLAAGGWQCRVLVRSRQPRQWPSNTQVVMGSLTDSAALHELLSGVDAVVHCAGRVRGASTHDFLRDNAEGTATLASLAAQQTHSPYFLMLSSLAAREPSLSAYAQSKREAEKCLSVAGERLCWGVLRPPAVYGPGDREMRPLLRSLLAGWGPVLGSSTARLSLLHVDDLVEAIVAALAQGCPGVFEVHDGRPGGYSWDEILHTAAQVRGGRVRRVPVPAMMLRVLAQANRLVSSLLGRDPMLTPGKVRELRYPDWVCDNAAFTAASAWVPRIDLATGLRQLQQQLSR